MTVIPVQDEQGRVRDGVEINQVVCNAVLCFEPRHLYVSDCLDEWVRTYCPTHRSWNGYASTTVDLTFTL